MVLKSPAKVNLYLKVLKKRTDGYHDIATIYEKIALFDIISIWPKEKGVSVTTDNPALVTDKRNLAHKAARRLFKETGFKSGVCIDIKKNIPLSSGLGGGSSNAAATLLGLNRLFGFGLGIQELVKLGKGLGADVPFFLHESARFAVGRNRGDEITPIFVDNNINIWHILAFFNFGVSTKMAYKGLNLRLTPAPADVKMCVRFIRNNEIENLGDSLYNTLEEVVLTGHRSIGEVKGLLLKEGAYGALLSGSGSTVFGITKTREEAIAVRRRLQKIIRGRCRLSVVETFKA